MNRREFLEAVAAAAVVVPTLAGQDRSNEWGSPVFDLHFHLRPCCMGMVAKLIWQGDPQCSLRLHGFLVWSYRIRDLSAARSRLLLPMSFVVVVMPSEVTPFGERGCR